MKLGVGVLVVGVALAGLGCSSMLHVEPTDVRNTSAIAPTKAAYKSVMVLPPQGSERGAASELAALEKELLRRGIKVVSSGLTGRVVVEQTESGRGTEGAAGLSDLERALVLAKKSNADGLLQVAALGWKTGGRHYAKSEAGQFVPITKDQYAVRGEYHRWLVTSPELRFEGKLIDVESGEIVASIDLAFSVADASDTNVKVGQNSQEVRLSGEGPRDRVVNAVLTQLADIIAKGPPRKVASADEPKAEVPPATPQAGTPEKAESKKKPVR